MLFSFFFVFSPFLIPVFPERPSILDCAGTSLEAFILKDSKIFERYPEASVECYDSNCLYPEEYYEEMERISALHIGIIEKIGKDFDSEEFFRLMIVDTPADCSREYDEFETYMNCVSGEYLERFNRKNPSVE